MTHKRRTVHYFKHSFLVLWWLVTTRYMKEHPLKLTKKPRRCICLIWCTFITSTTDNPPLLAPCLVPACELVSRQWPFSPIRFRARILDLTEMYIGQPHYLLEINCSTSGLIFSRGDCLFSRYSNQDLMAADVLVGKLKVFFSFCTSSYCISRMLILMYFWTG